MNSCIASELDHIPRILPTQTRYKFEVNFKKFTITKYNSQSILNRGAIKTMLALFYPQAP
jgi:hypothetical protein